MAKQSKQKFGKNGINSKVTFNTSQVDKLLKSINQRLLNPVKAANQTSIIAAADIQDHFDKEQSPVGRWRPRKDNLPHPILTKSGKLRRGLKPVTSIVNGNVAIKFVPSAETKKYAYIHNSGGMIKNRAGRYTYMPKRQYGWLSAQAKEEIRKAWIKDIVG